jgi:hypothetical protein
MNKPKIIAFYLPQYHPVKENNEWFGEGFTEWTNVAKAKPLFKGHDQPRIPRDLGFYDLRLPEVRAKQAELAKEAGIDAFCYYHYWFGDNRVLLEKPLQEVVRLGEPDFPFCLCWANHSWYNKNWNPDTKRIDQKMIMEQKYSGDEDIVAHFNFLLPAFKDRRYLKVNDKLLFSIYAINDIPDFPHFKDLWNKLAYENGLPGFYFLSYTSKLAELNMQNFKATEGTILSLVTNIEFKQDYSKKNIVLDFLRAKVSELTKRPQLVFEYSEAMDYLLDKACFQDNIIPVIVPNWDYTPRRGAGGLILKNSCPELFKEHAKQALYMVQNKPIEKQMVFLKSWNEWGEGNYMEPDLTYGKGYISALKDVINELYK